MMQYQVHGFATRLSQASGVMLVGVGKSYEVARLGAALLRTVGVKAVAVHSTDVAHGDLNFLDSGSVIIGISHSGMTVETVEALVKAQSEFGCHTALITGDRGQWNGVDTYFKYSLEKDGSKHGTIPTESVRLQLQWINIIVCDLADKMTTQELHRAHTGGSLNEVYEAVEVEDE